MNSKKIILYGINLAKTSHLPKTPLFSLIDTNSLIFNNSQLRIYTHSIDRNSTPHATKPKRETQSRSAKIERTQRDCTPVQPALSPLDFSRSQKSVRVIPSPGNRSFSVCIIRSYVTKQRGEEQRWEGVNFARRKFSEAENYAREGVRA